MASKLNIRQVDILKDAKAMADIQSSLNDDALFIMQVSGGTAPIQAIKAKDMQTYFSHTDVDAVSDDNEYTIVLIDPDVQDSDHDGFILSRDSGGHAALSYNPDSNLLGVAGSVSMKADSVVLSMGADSEISLTHVHDTGILLNGASEFQFRDSGLKLHSSANGQLDVDADVELELTAPTVQIAAATLADLDVGGFDLDATGAISLSGSSTGEIQLSGALDVDAGSIAIDTAGAAAFRSAGSMTLSGSALDLDASGGAASIDATAAVSLGAGAASDFTVSSGDLSLLASASDAKVVVKGDHQSGVAIHLDGDAAEASIVDIDAGQLDIDASDWVKIDAADEIELQTTSADGHITLHSAHTAGQAILIDANAAAGSILDVDAGILTIDTQGAQTLTAGGAFLLDGASTVGIQGEGTISIGTADSGVAVNIGHSTSEVTIVDNLVVTGDLTVNGQNTVVNSTVTTIDDPLIVLGQGNITTSRDLGLIFEQTGSASNVGFFYDASETEFAMKTGMTEDGTTAGNINASGSYAKLHVGEIDADGDLDVSGNTVLHGNVDLGDAASDTVTFVADVDSDIKPEADGTRSLGESGSEWAKLWVNDIESENGALDLTATSVNVAGAFDVTGATTLDGAVTIGDAAADDLVVNSEDVDFANLAALANSGVAVADSLMIRDADAETAKHITVVELGQYLARGTSETATDSNGVRVDSNGVLSLSAQDKYFQSSSMTAGMTGTIDHNYATEIVQKSFAVYLNGQLQLKSGSISGDAGDYNVSGTTLTMNSDIDSDDVVVVRYLLK